jgi:hypothetical protein
MTDDPRVPAECLMVKVRWRVEMGRSPLDGKQLHAVPSEGALRRRLQRAKVVGNLPESADPKDLARYVQTIIHGMAVQPAGRASSDQIRRVAQVVLSAWPKRYLPKELWNLSRLPEAHFNLLPYPGQSDFGFRSGAVASAWSICKKDPISGA